MKDLDTSQKLNLMVEAGVDTLKIEGRKKDAHYVSSVVRLYRKKLDDLFGRSTLRDSAPQGARDLLASPENSEAAIRRDLSLSFQRQTTSFFFENRYHENVIDLSSPTHLGLKVGSVESIQNSTVHVRLVDSLEVHDGVRVISPKKIFHAKPQDGESIQTSNERLDDRYENKESAFAIRNLSFKGRTIYEAQSGMLVEIPVGDFAKTPNAGDLLYKTRSAELKRKVEKLAKPPLDARLRPMRAVGLSLTLRVLDDGLLKLTGQITRFNESIALASVQTNDQGLRQKGQLTDDLKEVLTLYGDEGVYVEELRTEGVDNYFIPKSILKELKKSLQEDLSVKLDRQVEQRTLKAKTELLSVEVPRSIEGTSKYAIKIDRLDYLPWLKDFLEGSKASIKEIVFEPKKAYINSLDAATFIKPLLEFADTTGVALRIALPTVIRAWDEPVLKKWIQAIDQAGIRRFEIGNPGALKLLSNFGVDVSALDLSTDFTMYSLNREAVEFWKTNGINSISLSIEDDLEDLSSLLKHWPKDVTPVSILYKDTPLFIAEACSLTALHNGCPTAKVCGYRSLDIENSKGEKFTVAHEGCKSIVYGKNAFSISGHRAKLEANGVKDFRLDFLTRLYTGDEFVSVIKACLSDQIVPGTHSANFLGRLK